MHREKGTVTQVVSHRGFAFLRGDDGRSRFFHAKDMEPIFAFEGLARGQAVTFVPTGELKGDPDAANNGLRATKVQLCR